MIAVVDADGVSATGKVHAARRQLRFEWWEQEPRTGIVKDGTTSNSLLRYDRSETAPCILTIAAHGDRGHWRIILCLTGTRA